MKGFIVITGIAVIIIMTFLHVLHKPYDEIRINPLDKEDLKSRWSTLRWDLDHMSAAPITFNEGVFEFISGEGSGFFEYSFNINSPKRYKALCVQAKLSAEYNYFNDLEGPKPSFVIVSINGTEVGRGPVIADNARGRIYSWTVKDKNLLNQLNLKTEGNTLRFEVPEGGSNISGLCVYSNKVAIPQIGDSSVLKAERMPVVIRLYKNPDKIKELPVPHFDPAFNPRDIAVYKTITNPRDNATDEYCYFLPKKKDDLTPYDLLLYFHSYGNPCDVLGNTQIIKLANKKNMIVVGIARRIVEKENNGLKYIDLETYLAAAEKVFDELCSDFNIDKSNIYTLGSSMGGGPSITYAATHDYVQASAIIHGVPMNEKYRSMLAKVPVLLYHGESDKSVNISVSKDLYEALEKLGGTVTLVAVPGIGHEWRYLWNPYEILEFYGNNERQM